jgi:outer membrane assembly lipoprotein YfiO
MMTMFLTVQSLLMSRRPAPFATSRAARRAPIVLLVVLALAAGSAACGASRNKIPAGTNEPDKFLFERGNEALKSKKWLSSREFFQTLIDTYPQSPHRADAKLGLADAYLGDGSLASQVLALNEYREFLSFFPTHARADYAQYKTAMAHYYQMAKAGRDQTETREALKEFQVFFDRYPNSALTAEAKKFHREALDRKGQSEFGIGLTYYRLRWYPGAVSRFEELLKGDPQFTFRDGAYYYLAESLVKLNRQAEALPLLEKLIAEFQQSEFLEDAQKRISEIKTALAAAVQKVS